MSEAFSIDAFLAGPRPARGSGRERIDAIRNGLPVSFVDALITSGRLTASEIDALILPRKTLAHRRKLGTLTPEQSDRLARAARVIAEAETTFGSREKAGRWLRRPTAPLDGEAPLSLLDTSEGILQIEALLDAIDHGIAA